MIVFEYEVRGSKAYHAKCKDGTDTEDNSISPAYAERRSNRHLEVVLVVLKQATREKVQLLEVALAIYSSDCVTDLVGQQADISPASGWSKLQL